MTELIRASVFAERMGVTFQAVKKAKEAGRITVYEEDREPETKFFRIRWPDARDEWLANSNPIRRTHVGGENQTGEPEVVLQTVGELYGSEPAKRGPGRPKKKPVDDVTSDDDEYSDHLPASATVAEARAFRERFEALKSKIAYEKEIGKLVDTADVKKQAFKAARAVRDALMNIPDRCAHELAAQTDPQRIHERLTEEIRQALSELAGEGEGDE